MSNESYPGSETWEARPPHSDWRRIAPEHVDDYRAKYWEVRLLTVAKTHAQISELDDASNACLELAAKHSLATDHGDTVGDMIREFSGQIRTGSVAQSAGGSGALSRDALIEIIMRETTDDIVADGWDRMGNPNVLVQGCKFVRRNIRTDAGEGYVDPVIAARKFAGFIADAVIAASPAQSSWQPIETAPRDDKFILVFYKEGAPQDTIAWDDNRFQWSNGHDDRPCYPTYWKPLGPDPSASSTESNPGFFANLTPEQQTSALEYDGPENHGDAALIQTVREGK